MKPKKLSWTPKRRGRIYCSPGCGRGCTHAEYIRANREAREALHRIGRETPTLAAGLKIRVWENMGWHWELRGADFALYRHNEGTFSILASPGGGGGRPSWMVEGGKPAVLLLRAVLRKARAEVRELQGAVDRMEALL